MSEAFLRNDLIWNWVFGLCGAAFVALVVAGALAIGSAALARDRAASRQLREGAAVALGVALLLAGLAGALWLIAGALG